MDIRSKIEAKIEEVLNEVLVDKVQEIIESELEALDIEDYVDVEDMVRDEIDRSL